MEISQEEAETHARLLAKEEGIFSGISSGGAVSAALRLSEREENAVIVCIICDRGDRYLSTGNYFIIELLLRATSPRAEFSSVLLKYLAPLLVTQGCSTRRRRLL